MSMPFDLDAAVGASVREPFHFTWGGQPFDLPLVLDLPIDRQLELIGAIEGIDDKNSDASKLLAILKLAVGDECLAELSAVKPLSAVGVMKLLTAWIEFQGDDLGKSPAASASSASTVRPLKATSRSGRARKTS